MLLTIYNKTSQTVIVNEQIGSLEGNSQRKYPLRIEQLEQARASLVRLEQKGVIAWSVAEDPNEDDRAEGSVISLLAKPTFNVSYVVGNALAGDTQNDCDILDPGDGSGIAYALTLPKGLGNIAIRNGLYDFNLGTIGANDQPLAIPSDIVVMGTGPATVVRARTDGHSQGVFVLNARAILTRMSCVAPQPTVPTGGTTALISVGGNDCEVSSIIASINPNDGDSLLSVVQVQPSARCHVTNNVLTNFNANTLGGFNNGVVDIASSQSIVSGNTITSALGNYCVSIQGASNYNYVAGNILNANGGTQLFIFPGTVGNVTAPNVLI